MALSRDPIKLVITITLLVALILQHAEAKTHHLYWEVNTTLTERTCAYVDLPLVNNMFPGPTVEIDEGDRVIVNVTNLTKWPVSIHWHGIKQFLTNWADGPSHITQCPVQQNTYYIYEFTVDNQSGTFFWHAHIHWLRATLYGAFIVHPKTKSWYASKENGSPPLDPNEVEGGYLNTMNPSLNITNANTLNSWPGHLLDCNAGRDLKIEVEKGKTYLLQLVNAAINEEHHFVVNNHKMTVVACDGNYVKPFQTSYVYIPPGGTTDVLVTFDQPTDAYYFGINVAEAPAASFNPPALPALGIFKYKGSQRSTPATYPTFPQAWSTQAVDLYVEKIKGMAGYNLPETMDHDLLYPIGTSSAFCYNSTELCVSPGFHDLKLIGSFQNFTFDEPQNTSVLEAYYYKQKGVYTADLPDQPAQLVNFIDENDENYVYGKRGAHVKVLKFNDTVQVVLQNMHGRGMLVHPIHLHGHNFYVIARNYSNYDPKTGPSIFNLVDPPLFNTYSVPSGGWVALRFQADNPGVWLIHCHFERHKTWGMETAFITQNGIGQSEILPGPKHPLPKC